MSQKVAVKITSEGVLVSHPLVQDWGDNSEIEVEQIDNALVLKPRSDSAGRTHDLIVSKMKAAGLIEDLPWVQPAVVSPEERARLAEKLGRGKPLSALILEEREERA